MQCGAVNRTMTGSMIEKDYRVVVGMGKTGFSCAQFLARAGLSFCAVDTRANPPMLESFREAFPDVFLQTGNIDPELLANATEIVMSPGLSTSEAFLNAAKTRHIPLVGDIELFYRQARAPIVAITGSNAKSTVTTLVGEMAKAARVNVAVGGNLGTPALELLDDAVELYVLELSSFQLELVNTFSAKVAAFLNISEDHMDRYTSLNDYIAAKRAIFNRCEIAVFNIQDRHTYPSATTSCKQVTFGVDQSSGNNKQRSDFGVITINNKQYLAKHAELLLDVGELKIAGMHNVSNALAALAIGEAAGLPMPVMCEVLKKFTGLPHRCQLVKTIHQVRYINDSKGTNVGATLAAIEGLAERHENKSRKNIVLIAGGEGKGADFTPLHDACQQSVKACVLIGRDAPLIAKAVADATQVVYAMDMPSAVQAASELATAHDTVLLSPACASFDMFKNYEHRGECFVQAVDALSVQESKR